MGFADHGADPEFLLQLPFQGGLRRFTRLDLSTRKLPAKRRGNLRRALGDQELPDRVADHGTNNFNNHPATLFEPGKPVNLRGSLRSRIDTRSPRPIRF
jgi:hypothetical protein